MPPSATRTRWRAPLLLLCLLHNLAAPPLSGAAANTEKHREYHANGALQLEAEVDSFGLPHGLTRTFSENGALLSEKRFANGQLEGISRLYYEDGRVMTEWVYSAGKREGPSIGYFANGRVKDKGFYRNDKLEGSVRQYHHNGKLKAEMTFKNDRMDGAAKTYDMEGRLEFVYTYRKGRLLNQKTYDSKGNVIQSRDFPSETLRP